MLRPVPLPLWGGERNANTPANKVFERKPHGSWTSRPQGHRLLRRAAARQGLPRALWPKPAAKVVINGRDAKALEATAAELSKLTGAKIIAVVADVASPDGQKALLAACPQPDILVNNNAGPPLRDFREALAGADDRRRWSPI